MLQVYKENAPKICSENLHVFDSSNGSPFSGGVIYNYSQPYVYFDSYRFSFITIFDFPGYASSSVYYLTVSATSSSNSNYLNGKYDPLLVVVPRTGLSGPCSLYNYNSPKINLGYQPMHSITFQLWDENKTKITTARYVVGLIVYSDK